MHVRRLFPSSVLLLSIFLLSARLAVASPLSFSGLGLISNLANTAAWGISGDGSLIVGMASSKTPNPGGNSGIMRGFRWFTDGTRDGLTPNGVASSGNAVTGDGAKIAGFIGLQAVRWDPGKVVPLGMLPGATFSSAFGLSSDGSVVVGSSGNAPNDAANFAFRWTAETGIVGLESLASFPNSSANGVSGDGSTIVGYIRNPATDQIRAVRWTDEGLFSLGILPGLGGNGTAFSISADGSTVVGWSGSGAKYQAFRWTENEGMRGLGYLPGFNYSVGWASSYGGTAIVGHASTSNLTQTPGGAFLWTPSTGMLSLQQLLTSRGVLPDGWQLTVASGISFDGSTIVGYGVNPQGVTEGWVAHVPEPGAVGLAATGAAILAGAAVRRRSSSRRRRASTS